MPWCKRRHFVMIGRTAQRVAMSRFLHIRENGIYTEAGFPYKYVSSRSFPESLRFKKVPDNVPQQGDVGVWAGHVLIYDKYAGPGLNAWTARRPEFKFGPGSTSWWEKNLGPVTWYRYDK